MRDILSLVYPWVPSTLVYMPSQHPLVGVSRRVHAGPLTVLSGLASPRSWPAFLVPKPGCPYSLFYRGFWVFLAINSRYSWVFLGYSCQKGPHPGAIAGVMCGGEKGAHLQF